MQPNVFLDYDQAELDRQYDQRAWAANAVEVIARYASDSDKARGRLGPPRTFAYGPTPAETVDVYLTGRSNAPIHAFIHGGAWRSLSKRESAFAAEAFVSAGAHFIAVDFALLPTLSLQQMVDQVRRAVAWIYSNARQFGGDSDQLFLSGHSSGGHLAAAVLTTDWSGQFSLPQSIVKGGLCASGIYDLYPVRLSARNGYVRLDSQTEHDLSPYRFVDRLTCPVAVAIGEFESDEFRRQARAFASAIEQAGREVTPVECAGVNHFEMIESLADPAGVLGRVALAQMGLNRSRAD
jgi:arylformamidase